MKKFVLAILLLSPVSAFPQTGLDPDMMQQLQEMANCMATIDKTEIKAMEAQSKEIENEIKALCNAGKRDDAQSKGIEFAKEIMRSPALVTMRKCTENIPPAMKSMIPDMSEEIITQHATATHVCDEI